MMMRMSFRYGDLEDGELHVTMMMTVMVTMSFTKTFTSARISEIPYCLLVHAVSVSMLVLSREYQRGP